MRVNIVTRITISATPKEVFGYLSDLKYHYLWNPQIRELKPIAKLKKGMTYQTTNVVLGVKLDTHNKVTKFIRNQELEVTNETGMVHYCVNYQVQQKGKKTQVICTTVVTADTNYFSFAKPVLKLLAQRELQTDMQALKLAVENKLQ